MKSVSAEIAVAIPEQDRNKGNQHEVPGAWLQFDKTNRAAKQLKNNSEVLKYLDQLKEKWKNADQRPKWILTPQADVFFACVIIAYAIMIGFDVEITIRPIQVDSWVENLMLVLQTIFVLLFIVEIVLHVEAEGLRYCFPTNPSGFFDTVVILLGVLELVLSLYAKIAGAAVPQQFSAAGAARLLRLLRLVRIVRVMVVCRELRMLFKGMFSSLSAVFWSFCLLLMLMYLGTLFCVILLGNEANLQQYFGTVPMGLFTHFTLVTLEAWPDVSDAVMTSASDTWCIYFILFICATSLALMNLVTGVVCEKLMGASAAGDLEWEEHKTDYHDEVMEFRQGLKKIFEDKFPEDCGVVTQDRLRDVMRGQEMKDLLDFMDVSTDIQVEQIFEILDHEGSGAFSLDELMQALLRLRGSKHQLHSMMLQRDVVRCKKREQAALEELENTICKQHAEELAAIDVLLDSELAALQIPSSAHQSPDAVQQLHEAHQQNLPGESSTAEKLIATSKSPGGVSLAESAAKLESLIAQLDSLQAFAEKLLDDDSAGDTRKSQTQCISQGTQTGEEEMLDSLPHVDADSATANALLQLET